MKFKVIDGNPREIESKMKTFLTLADVKHIAVHGSPPRFALFLLYEPIKKSKEEPAKEGNKDGNS